MANMYALGLAARWALGLAARWALALSVSLLALSGCKSNAAPQVPPPPEVGVMEVRLRSVTAQVSIALIEVSIKRGYLQNGLRRPLAKSARVE